MGSLARRGSCGELLGFVCTVFSGVNGNRKSVLLITRSSGVYKTRSFAAQIPTRPRAVSRAVLFALGSGSQQRSLSVTALCIPELR